MSKLGKELIAAVKEANKKGLQTLTLSPDIAKLRKQLKLTQRQFAEIYHLQLETIKKWEQKKRIPDSISKAYLKCIQQNPEIIAKLVNTKKCIEEISQSYIS